MQLCGKTATWKPYEVFLLAVVSNASFCLTNYLVLNQSQTVLNSEVASNKFLVGIVMATVARVPLCRRLKET
jgi:hypothetical protein